MWLDTCIDAFFFTVDKTNGDCCRSILFIPVIPFYKIEEWKERGITIFELLIHLLNLCDFVAA